jgi:2-polyprenyl-3-methyl-5-hydroxy-6-metoxy-1,4-benzoquinol methylase
MNDWDQYADTWDGDENTRAYAAAAFASLQPVLALHGVTLNGGRVCDFGCGTGLLTEHLVGNGATVDAVDTSVAMLAVLRAKVERHGWRDVRMATGLPDQGPYDLIVCSSVCAFLDDYPATVAELVARLRPGGLFVQWDWERNESADDPHGLTRDEIHRALTAVGLVDIRVNTGFEIDVAEQSMRPLIGHGHRNGAPRSSVRGH